MSNSDSKIIKPRSDAGRKGPAREDRDPGKALERVDRRAFIGRLGAGALATAAFGEGYALTIGTIDPAGVGAMPSGNKRRNDARRLRNDMTKLAFDRPLPEHPQNGEEHDYPYVANFSKGLRHDNLGQVFPQDYQKLLSAVASGAKSDFERIPLGGARKLRNPLAGLAFELEGPDSHQTAIRPAPRIDSPENSSEMAELYWMALARDASFTEYDTNSLIDDAADDLTTFTDFRAPKEGGQVTPATIFRGNTPGDLAGPYISQFLFQDIPFGAQTIVQRGSVPAPGVDHVTDVATWLAIQRGQNTFATDVLDITPRYIRNGRDLARYVQVDALYQAYLGACLILLGMGAPFDPGNPYMHSATMDAFGTFGGPHILSLLTEVATRALKTVWYQKWFVHRRLRPEAFGGRVHHQITGAATFPIDHEILDSQAVDAVFNRFGTYLLPQAYPDASPLHPSYGSGHATVAGACVTILKAWFDESYVIPDPVVPDADGTSLVPYTGPDADQLTVSGELNKVASNIASGRNFAGIHWRSDFVESLTLGETVALGVLEEQHPTYKEGGSFTLTKFDGTTVTI